MFLDTHAILWYFQGNENLPKKIRTIIESKSCFYSIISFWEIAIKQKLGKLDSSFSIQELESMCTKANIQIAPITSKSIETTKFLPLIHRDPFDRLLIAQAKNLNLILITKDMFIPQYDVKILW
ncbi:MAG: type II toxin-antitoxin system VapC family toxin [Spirochaetales bacterium]|nr:type II toxin-antitoxin system VapC family toxin [Spirochaetales bacterium]